MMIFNRKISFIFPLILLVGLFVGGPVLAEEAVSSHEAAAIEEGAHHAVSSAEAVAEHGAEAVEHAAEGHEGHEGGHEGHGHGEHHHGVTHSQLMNFIWHCLNFTLLLVILIKYGKQPVADALKGRQESIAKAFDELEAKKEAAIKKYHEYEQKLSGMDEEAKRILENFIKQGEAEKEKIITQAHEAAERIKAQAEFYVQQELAKAKVELQREIAETAVKMAEDIIRKNLNEQDHSRLISEYLERVVQKN